MIKKAILLLLTIPFLMMFSNYSFATDNPCFNGVFDKFYAEKVTADYITYFRVRHNPRAGEWGQRADLGQGWCTLRRSATDDFDFYHENPLGIPPKTDEECEQYSGSSVPLSHSSADYLTSGGSVSMEGGTCSVTGAGAVCDNENCTVTLKSTSTGEAGEFRLANDENDIDLRQIANSDYPSPGNPASADFLRRLPIRGADDYCASRSDCVFIDGGLYLVEWDIAPHWFGHVDSNGDIVINREGVTLDGGDGDTGGGSTDDGSNGGGSTGGGSTGGGSSGGGSSGGGSSGGGSGDGGSGDGGSTVPEFDLDESAIIAAIESAGRANQNAIRALSNDTMGKIDQQTDTLNAATTAQTNALNSSLAAQTDTVNSALDSQTNTLNQTLDNRTDNLSRQLDDQNTRFSAAFDSLGNTVTDAIERFEADGEDSGGDGDSEGLLDAIPGLLESLVDNLAGRFTEQVGEGDDLLNTAGMDTTLDSLNDQETQYGEDVKTLMDEIGDGATSSIADQITSRLPSLPSGGCVPLQFGPMEISCQAFNTIKLWLTWIIYFWTVVSIVDTFFRSEQRTA